MRNTMKKDPLPLNQIIKEEAGKLLYEKGLLAILNNYGLVHITGSYALDLMTWRDLDIYIATNTITEAQFFELGAAINCKFNPVKMSYRNERIQRSEGLPPGLYWGVYFGNERKDAWKIDIWAMDEKECKRRIQYCDDLAARINDSAKQAILAIKSACWTDPEYRRSYAGKDIYEAVLDNKIRTIEEFRGFLKTKDRK